VGAFRAETVHSSWRAVFNANASGLDAIDRFLAAESDSRQTVLPPASSVFAAFNEPLDSVRVVIVGQDPYPTPGHAVGLAFSVAPEVRPIPRSLHNIYRELESDLGIQPAEHGDLTAWTRQGVLLLNRVLTVRAGEAGAHRGIGWEAITESVLATLARRERPLVAILWGKDAQSALPFLGETPIVSSAHPSPLSAHNGFFGSRPFSRVNELLRQQGGEPIDWRV
jgi:uracil-DNA glycosylase